MLVYFNVVLILTGVIQLIESLMIIRYPTGQYIKMSNAVLRSATKNNIREITHLQHAFNQAAIDSVGYSFIDSGNLKRLEKFGPYYVVRSCPAATWGLNHNIPEWNHPQRLEYKGQSGRVGSWYGLQHIQTDMEWITQMDEKMVFTLAPSDYGQIGIFPEQYENWKWIKNICQEHINSKRSTTTTTTTTNSQTAITSSSSSSLSSSDTNNNITPSTENILHNKVLIDGNPTSTTNTSSLNAIATTEINHKSLKSPPIMRILNGFSYTGGSSMAALQIDGVEVVHVDASKSAVQWACRNAHASGLIDRPVRWLVDDIVRFVEREVRRGSYYEGLIFDPPAFGRTNKVSGVKSNVWRIDHDLPKLAEQFSKLLSESAKFVLLTSHDANWTDEKLAELLDSFCPADGQIEFGQLILDPIYNYKETLYDIITQQTLQYQQVQQSQLQSQQQQQQLQSGVTSLPSTTITTSTTTTTLKSKKTTVNPLLLGNKLPMGYYARWYR